MPKYCGRCAKGVGCFRSFVQPRRVSTHLPFRYQRAARYVVCIYARPHPPQIISSRHCVHADHVGCELQRNAPCSPPPVTSSAPTYGHISCALPCQRHCVHADHDSCELQCHVACVPPSVTSAACGPISPTVPGPSLLATLAARLRSRRRRLRRAFAA